MYKLCNSITLVWCPYSIRAPTEKIRILLEILFRAAKESREKRSNYLFNLIKEDFADMKKSRIANSQAQI